MNDARPRFCATEPKGVFVVIDAPGEVPGLLLPAAAICSGHTILEARTNEFRQVSRDLTGPALG